MEKVFVVIREVRYYNKTGEMIDCHTSVIGTYLSVESANKIIDQKKIELEQEYRHKNVISMCWYKGEDYAITWEEDNADIKLNSTTIEYYLSIQNVEP